MIHRRSPCRQRPLSAPRIRPSLISGVSIADVDAVSGELLVTLGVSNGTLTMSTLTGLTFTVGDGTADAAMTFTGTLTDINNALASLSYDPALNFNGNDTLNITVDDQGNTGGGPLGDSDSLTIVVLPVNDAPVNTVPGPQSLVENTSLTFTGATAISVFDLDVNPAINLVEVELTVSDGTLTLGSTTGITVTGGANGTDSVTIKGTFNNVNAALNGLVYTPDTNYNGPDQLSVTTNDLGNIGAGSPLVDISTVDLTIEEANTPPAFTGLLPTEITIEEDVVGDFDFGSLQIDDPDVAGGTMTLTLTASAGLLFSTDPLVLSGDGTGTLELQGTQAQLNTLLSTPGVVTYQGPSNQNDLNAVDPTVEVKVSDEGNTGAGPIGVTVAGSVEIELTAVNDPPEITAPLTVNATEDTTFSFTAGDTISIADVDIDEDALPDTLLVDLEVTDGTLTLGTMTGLTFITGDGDDDALMSFSGLLADVNAALATLSFDPDLNFAGTATLDIDVDDSGSTGTGPGTSSKSVDINVAAVDDAPDIDVPAPQSTNEDASLTFSTGNGNPISVSDVDSDPLDVTLTVSNGV